MSSRSNSWFLADDFSGALEVGAILRKSGKSVKIVFDSRAQGDVDGISGISSETRNVARSEAEERLTKLLEAVGDRWLRFKKIDSTMRGPIGVELDVIAKRWPNRPILFTPTNPDAGRSVKNGCLFVDGVPVSQTAFASDPTAPVAADCISKIIRDTGGPESISIALDMERSSEEEIQRQFRAGWSKCQVLVADASSLGDLEKIVLAAQNIAADFLPCGSGGLARAMDAAGMFSDLDSHSRPLIPKTGRVLFVIGSLHPQSRSQVKYVQDQMNLPVEFVTLDQSGESGHLVNRLIAELLENGVLVVVSEVPAIDEQMSRERAHVNAEFMANLTRDVCACGLVDSLFVTGGETARAVIEGLGCRHLDLEDEFRPGVAVAKMSCANAKKTTLIVKPGGFGSDDLFGKIISSFGNL